MCQEEGTAIIDPNTVVTMVPAVAICGALIASAKEWGFFRDGESDRIDYHVAILQIYKSFVFLT